MVAIVIKLRIFDVIYGSGSLTSGDVYHSISHKKKVLGYTLNCAKFDGITTDQTKSH